MYKILIFFLFVVAYSFLWNTFSYLKCKSLFDEYKNYITCIASDTSYNGDFIYKKNEIIRLFDRAGIKHFSFPNVTPVGYGQLARSSFDPFDNLFANDMRVVQSVTSAFETSIGEYRQRIWNSINPLYWIHTIIFLPKVLMEYLGVQSDNVPTKILQVIYWIVSVFYTIFSDKINQMIQSFLSNLFK